MMLRSLYAVAVLETAQAFQQADRLRAVTSASLAGNSRGCCCRVLGGTKSGVTGPGLHRRERPALPTGVLLRTTHSRLLVDAAPIIRAPSNSSEPCIGWRRRMTSWPSVTRCWATQQEQWTERGRCGRGSRKCRGATRRAATTRVQIEEQAGKRRSGDWPVLPAVGGKRAEGRRSDAHGADSGRTGCLWTEACEALQQARMPIRDGRPTFASPETQLVQNGDGQKPWPCTMRRSRPSRKTHDLRHNRALYIAVELRGF